MFASGWVSDREQPEHVRRWQDVLNFHWPVEPSGYKYRDDPILVRARLVCARDGEQYCDGKATRWDTNHVYVEIPDARLRGNGVWLKPADVYRRSAK